MIVATEMLWQIRVVDLAGLHLRLELFFRLLSFIGGIVNQDTKPGFIAWRPTLGNLVIPFFA